LQEEGVAPSQAVRGRELLIFKGLREVAGTTRLLHQPRSRKQFVEGRNQKRPAGTGRKTVALKERSVAAREPNLTSSLQERWRRIASRPPRRWPATRARMR